VIALKNLTNVKDASVEVNQLKIVKRIMNQFIKKKKKLISQLMILFLGMNENSLKGLKRKVKNRKMTKKNH
jgi:hypothetical protein